MNRRRIATLTDGVLDAPVREVSLGALPTGLIVLWRGDKAPPGWDVCDGTNGTPDMSAHVPKGPGFRLVYIRKA